MADVSYVERLRVPVGWWIGALLLVGSIAVALFAYLAFPVASAGTALIAIAVLGVLWGYSRTTIRVDDDSLSVGRFVLGSPWIDTAEPLDAAQTTDALGAHADVRDFLLTRPYLKGGVRVRVADAADPHPHWVISSRRPEELAAAVEAIAGAES